MDGDYREVVFLPERGEKSKDVQPTYFQPDIKKELGEYLVELLGNSEGKTITRIFEERYGQKSSKDSEYIQEIYNLIEAIFTYDQRTLVNIISESGCGYDSPLFDQQRRNQADKDEVLTAMFEVEEGVITCRCGSKRTYSSQRQTRGGDEGSTTFVVCAKCGKRWKM